MKDPEMTANEILVRDTGRDKNGKERWSRYKSFSETPHAPATLYAQNDRFLEFRTPFDERRGLITLASTMGGGLVFMSSALLMLIMSFIFKEYGLLLTIVSIFCLIAIFYLSIKYFKKKKEVKIMSNPAYDPVLDALIKILLIGAALFVLSRFIENELLISIGYYIVFILLSILASLLPYFFSIVAKKFVRLEIFVQRRLLVRFDRVNRKVYLHRPKYAGGIVALPWDALIVDTDPNARSFFGAPIDLSWNEADTPHGLPDGTVVGRLAHSNEELRDRWEFIRRFMEEGPESVPREKLLSKFTWPWNSVISVSGMVWPLFSSWLNWFMLIGGILLIPAMLFYSVFHWFSLLLCWEPVFPREIREACGETFRDVLKTRLVDLVAWLMLAPVVWWVFVPLAQSFILSVFN